MKSKKYFISHALRAQMKHWIWKQAKYVPVNTIKKSLQSNLFKIFFIQMLNYYADLTGQSPHYKMC